MQLFGGLYFEKCGVQLEPKARDSTTQVEINSSNENIVCFTREAQRKRLLSLLSTCNDGFPMGVMRVKIFTIISPYDIRNVFEINLSLLLSMLLL